MNPQHNPGSGDGGRQPENSAFRGGVGSTSGTSFHQTFTGPCTPNIFIFQQPGDYSVNLHRFAGNGQGQPGVGSQNRAAQLQTPAANSSFAFAGGNGAPPGRFQPSPIRPPGQGFPQN